MFQSFSSDTHPLQALYVSLKDAPGYVSFPWTRLSSIRSWAHPLSFNSIVPHSIPTDPDDPFWMPDIYALDIHQVWPWSKFLDPSLFVGFPALRGISVEQIMWPETQYVALITSFIDSNQRLLGMKWW